jgi:hypothetical protein
VPCKRQKTVADEVVPVWGAGLRWRRNHLGLSEERLAVRAKGRLNRTRLRGKKSRLSGPNIHYWEARDGRETHLSVLKAVAAELQVPVDFLRYDRPHTAVPLAIAIPERPPVRLEMSDAFGGEVTWLHAPANPADNELVTVGCSLSWWRLILLGSEPERDPNATLAFLEHMSRALEILLAPVGKGATVREQAIREMTALLDTALIAATEQGRLVAPGGLTGRPIQDRRPEAVASFL